MDTDRRLVDWAKQMGYQGRMPRNLKPICNASTSHIWEQIMEKVKPRQDIEIARKNLIIQQLEKEIHLELDNVPIKEVEIWRKRNAMQMKVNEIEAVIREKERKIDKINQNNKALYLTKETVEKRIKENSEKILLYERKSDDLKQEIRIAEEKINCCGKLTPVEDSDNSDVNDTLIKVSEKLENLIINNNEMDEANLLGNVSNVSLINLTSNVTTPRITYKFCNPMERGVNSIRKTPKLMQSTHKNTKLNVSLGLINDETINECHLNQYLNYLKDPTIATEVDSILQHNNRSVLWHIIKKAEEDLKTNLNKYIFDNSHDELERFSETRLRNLDLSKLHTLHIENEFKAAKFQLKTNALRQQLSEREKIVKDALTSQTNNSSKINEIMAIIELHKNEAGLLAANTLLNAEMENLKDGLSKKYVYVDLRKEEQRYMDLQTKYVEILKKLIFKLQIFAQISRMIQTTRDSTYTMVRKLNCFTDDFGWILALNEGVNSYELEKFDDICLDYLRKYTYTDNQSESFTRYFNANHVPYVEDMDPNVIARLAAFLDTPSCVPEAALIAILQSKMKLETFKSLKELNVDKTATTYTYEQLQSQESYMNYAIDKLIYIIRTSNSTKKSMNILKIKETMKIWLEMPFKDFLSSARLFNSHGYQYYEELYDKHYNQL